MRVVREGDSIENAVTTARSEALAAFGNGDVFLERLVSLLYKYIGNERRLILERFLHRPKHIEVQTLSDKYGNHVHLFERDCSVQRRHQKVIEIAPSPNLSSKILQRILKAAIDLVTALNYGMYL